MSIELNGRKLKDLRLFSRNLDDTSGASIIGRLAKLWPIRAFVLLRYSLFGFLTKYLNLLGSREIFERQCLRLCDNGMPIERELIEFTATA